LSFIQVLKHGDLRCTQNKSRDLQTIERHMTRVMSAQIFGILVFRFFSFCASHFSLHRTSVIISEWKIINVIRIFSLITPITSI